MDNCQDLNIMKRMKLLYSSSKWHDIEFHINSCGTGETVVISAHRLILATCSPVFEALCYGPLAAKGAVAVPDIEPDAFNAMLKFLYTNILELKSVEVVSSLYYAANKYLLPALCKLACEYLIENINEMNCLDLYDMACIFQEDMLIKETWSYICSHLNFVYKHVRDDNINSRLLVELVSAPMLDADEIVLVRLSLKWAENACKARNLEKTGLNIRKLLTQCLIFQGIRWNLLSKEDFKLFLPGLFSEEEVLSLTNSEGSVLANAPPRMKPPVKMYFIHRFLEREISTISPRDGMTVSTAIVSNRSGILHGFFVCCTQSLIQPDSSATYKERLVASVLDSDRNVLAKEQEFKKEVTSGEPFLVSLVQPLPISAHTAYDIRIQLLNSSHIYEFGARNSRAKIPSGISVTFKEAADIYEKGVFITSPHISLLSGLQMSL